MSTNPKAEAARERELQAKTAAKSAKQKAEEDAKWEDEKNNKYLLKQKQELEKQKLAAEKRAMLKALEAKDQASLAKKVVPTKLTMANIQSIKSRYEIEAEQKKKEAQEAKTNIIYHEEPAPNANVRKIESEFVMEKLVDARSLTDAVNQLSMEETNDRHPEKRMKAAYLKFEEEQMPILKQEYPTYKFSQLKQEIWNLWQKSADNPLNSK